MNTFKHGIFTLLSVTVLLAGCGDKPEPKAEAAAAETGAHIEHEAEGGHAEPLKLTPEARKAAGLVIAPVGPAKISEVIPLYGTLKPNAEAVRSVTARFPGVVRSVNAAVGDEVKQGAVLATVESNESLQVYPVTSPLAGIVTERFTNAGEQSGTPLFTVANLSTLWAELSLFPRDRSRIRVGQSVRVKVTEADQAVIGKVIYISPLGTSSTQSLSARVVLTNRDGLLSPGLYVRGDVSVSEAEVALAVPVGAIQELEGGTSVFVEDEDGLEPRVVKTGRTDGVFIEILEGLSAGDKVVVEGSFVLKAEMGKGEAEHEH